MENYYMKIQLERKIIQTFFPLIKSQNAQAFFRHNEIITLLVP